MDMNCLRMGVRYNGLRKSIATKLNDLQNSGSKKVYAALDVQPE